MHLSNVELKNNIFVAPMAGITNSAFRKICDEFNAGLCVSEMISDMGIHYGNKRTFDMLKRYEDEYPFCAQIFGFDPYYMGNASKIVSEYADIIDINMGCPVSKVIKTGAGSALLKDPYKVYDVAKSVVDNTDKPVTCKIRLGFDRNSINVIEISKKLVEAGVSAISIHGRCRSDFYSGEVSYEWIKRVKEEVDIKVIANGDIDSYEKAKYVLDYTGADGIMIGRASIGNPFFIDELYHKFMGKEYIEPSNADRVLMAIRHCKDLCDLFGENIGIKNMRGIGTFYVKGLPNSANIKNKINRVNSFNEFELIMREYLKEV